MTLTLPIRQQIIPTHVAYILTGFASSALIDLADRLYFYANTLRRDLAVALRPL